MNSELQVQLCRVFKVEWIDVTGRCKKSTLSDARHAYCFASRLITGKSDKAIGQEIGRHRTNVTRSVLKATCFLEIDEQPFVRLLYQLLQSINCDYVYKRSAKKYINQNLNKCISKN